MSSKQARIMSDIKKTTKQKILNDCNENEYLSTQEIADRLKILVSCVNAHAKKPDFPIPRIALRGKTKCKFYQVDDVDEWFEKNTNHKPPPRKLIQQFYQILHDTRQNNKFAYRIS